MPKGHKLFMSLVLLLGFSSSALGNSTIELPSTFTQSLFKDLSREVGLAISYTPLAPAAPLGIVGFDVGVAVTAVRIESNEDFWEKAVGETPPSFLVFPKVQVQKGLPFGLDIGLVYAKAVSSNIGLIGGELKYAFLKGTLATPALAIRGHYTRLLGVDDLEMQVYGADLSISKGFGIITPYAGIGQVWIVSRENSDPVSLDLDKENLTETKGFLGVRISLFILSFVAEASFSEAPSYSGRLNISF